MPASHFSYYDYDEDTELTCASCGWRGPARRGSSEYYSELFDVSCPRCGEMIAIVAYPTDAETRAAAAAGDPRAVKGLREIEEGEEFAKRWGESSLKHPGQLPDIDEERFELIWDLEPGLKDGDSWTVIRHGDREIWREVAVWEGSGRYVDVWRILRDRYGDRVVELLPTAASCDYLGGDHYSDAFWRVRAEIDRAGESA